MVWSQQVTALVEKLRIMVTRGSDSVSEVFEFYGFVHRHNKKST